MTAAENSEDVRPELTKIPAKPENLSKHPLDPLTPQEVSLASRRLSGICVWQISCMDT